VGGPPGGDTPDDTVSAASAALPDGFPPVEGASVIRRRGQVAVFTPGFSEETLATLEHERLGPVTASSLNGGLVPPAQVAVVPSGALSGMDQSDQFKAELESYVVSGGTVVVFSQQLGSDFSVLPTPDGLPIDAYGWLEDQSCYSDSSYLEALHPALASQANAVVSSAVDGYFTGLPEGSTVLLRRVRSGTPVMFTYPYGAGRVIVTSSYDDWGGFNQAARGARAIIRDTVTWALDPAPLPMYGRGDSVSVPVLVQNTSGKQASQVHLWLMSPSRDQVLLETTEAVTVSAGGEATVTLTHGFATDARPD
jgi:hypothetical protein